MSTINGQNFIGAENSARGSQSFKAVNPSSGALLEPTFIEATIEEVDSAVAKAVEAFVAYRKLSDKDRASFLNTIADQIEVMAPAIIERAMLETALPEGRLKGECNRTVNQIRMFAGLLEDGSWVNARIDGNIRQMQVPLGPVGIFGASNFPLAFSVAGGDTASALAAGCPVIVKGHPAHPGTSELVGQAIRNAARQSNIHPGIFSLVQGPSIAVGMAIVEHPAITAIGFTGSYRGGKAIFDAANQRAIPIPVYSEMGSTNPVFILPGALAERGQEIAEGLVKSVNLGVGQFCTNPGLVIGLNGGQLTQFIDNAAGIMENTSGGTMLTKGISDAFMKGVSSQGDTPGVTTKVSGLKSNAFATSQPFFLQTSAANFNQNSSLEEEVFGPSSLIITANSKQEVLEIANNLSGHLTATVHGNAQDFQDFKVLFDILSQKVGRLIINGFPTGVAVNHSMVHGGPFPATTNSRSTSVGSAAIYRFTRPICYQDFPQELLPEALQDDNPLAIARMIDGKWVV